MSITPNFSGEMQLAGWSESHTAGCKVTFWLQSTEDLEAFRALTVRKGNQAGHRFMAVLVEVGDDEQPVPPPTVKESLQVEKPKGGALSKLAGVWCARQEFWEWLETDPLNAAHSPEGAAACVRSICEVESRAELDHDEAAAERFHRLIRGPFSKYMLAKGIAL